MQKKKIDIFNLVKLEIINNIKSYVIVTAFFTIGVFLGVMFINYSDSKENVEKYINTYIDETKQIQNVDYFKEQKDELQNNIGLVVLLWFAGTTIIGIPIVFGIILVRGFCLGYTIASYVCILGKLKGILFIFISIFLQNLIIIPSIIILGVSSIKLYKSIIKDRRKENIKISILKHSIISISIAIVLILATFVKIQISYRLILLLVKYF